MQYSELVDFIELRMRMSHIYQPLLIRSLVDAGGSATVRQLAQSRLPLLKTRVAEGRFVGVRLRLERSRLHNRHGSPAHWPHDPEKSPALDEASEPNIATRKTILGSRKGGHTLPTSLGSRARQNRTWQC